MTDYTLTMELLPGDYECEINMEALRQVTEEIERRMWEAFAFGVSPDTIRRVNKMFDEEINS